MTMKAFKNPQRLFRPLFFFSVFFCGMFVSGKVSDPETNIIFEKEKIKIGSQTINVEVAKSAEQHERGLMYRMSLPENAGMIFIFPTEQPLSFWMKNTFIDLSIGYFDSEKILVDIQEMKATTSMMEAKPAVYPSKRPAMYALEMNKGWFSQHKVKVGDRFDFVNKLKIKKSVR